MADMMTRPQAATPPPTRALAPTAPPVVAVKAWAAVGAVCVAFIVFIWAKWLTGPYSERVTSGATELPGWMKVAMVAAQIAAVVLTAAALWALLVRPWRRERRLTTDGVLCIAYFFCVFQDPLSNWFSPWITYNTYLLNLGSWTHEMPGWVSFGQPGAQAAEPLIWPMLYMLIWTAWTVSACWLMRHAKERWPQLGPFRLLGIAFVWIAVTDFVVEGLIFMPLGFWSYPGGPLPISFPSTHYAFPLHEMILIGVMGTGFAALRYFRDDRGLTIVERGADKLTNPVQRGLYRVLAVVAATQIVFAIGFTLPAMIVGANAREWPADTQQRSYLNDKLCGAGTDRACPGPAIPLPRREHSLRVAPDGSLVVPAGVKLPSAVPLLP